MVIPEALDFTALLQPCVYALTLKGEVVYVGQSKKALSRLYTHATAWRAHVKGRAQLPWFKGMARKFDGILVWPCPLGALSGLEQDLVRHYQPKGNTQHKKAAAAYDRPIEVDDEGIVEGPLVLVVNGHRIELRQRGKEPPPIVEPPRIWRRI
jgi:hypothetical protein